MAEQLRLQATVEDKFSEPLRRLRQHLGEIKTPEHLREMREHFEGVRKVVDQTSEAIKTGLEPALAGIGIKSLAAGSALVGVVQALNGFKEAGNNLRHLQNETGIAAASIRQFDAVFEQLGVKAEATNASLRTFATHLREIQLNRGIAGELRGFAPELAADLKIKIDKNDAEGALNEALGFLQSKVRNTQDRMQIAGMLFGNAQIGEAVGSETPAKIAEMWKEAKKDLGAYGAAQLKAAHDMEESGLRLNQQAVGVRDKYMTDLAGPAATLLDLAGRALQNVGSVGTVAAGYLGYKTVRGAVGLGTSIARLGQGAGEATLKGGRFAGAGRAAASAVVEATKAGSAEAAAMTPEEASARQISKWRDYRAANLLDAVPKQGFWSGAGRVLGGAARFADMAAWPLMLRDIGELKNPTTPAGAPYRNDQLPDWPAIFEKSRRAREEWRSDPEAARGRALGALPYGMPRVQPSRPRTPTPMHFDDLADGRLARGHAVEAIPSWGMIRSNLKESAIDKGVFLGGHWGINKLFEMLPKPKGYNAAEAERMESRGPLAMFNDLVASIAKKGRYNDIPSAAYDYDGPQVRGYMSGPGRSPTGMYNRARKSNLSLHGLTDTPAMPFDDDKMTKSVTKGVVDGMRTFFGQFSANGTGAGGGGFMNASWDGGGSGGGGGIGSAARRRYSGGAGGGYAGADAGEHPAVGHKGFDQKAPGLVHRMMKDFGLTEEQAAGAVGFMGGESAGTLSPSIVRSGGTDTGWAQWVGKRRRGLYAMAGVPLGQASKLTDENNYSWLKHELTEGDYRAVLPALRKAHNYREALAIWADKFEGAGGTPTGLSANIRTHMPYASRAMQLLHGKGSTETSPFGGPVAHTATGQPVYTDKNGNAMPTPHVDGAIRGSMGADKPVEPKGSVDVHLHGFPMQVRARTNSDGFFQTVKVNRGRTMSLASEEA